MVYWNSFFYLWDEPIIAEKSLMRYSSLGSFCNSDSRKNSLTIDESFFELPGEKVARDQGVVAAFMKIGGVIALFLIFPLFEPA